MSLPVGSSADTAARLAAAMALEWKLGVQTDNCGKKLFSQHFTGFVIGLLAIIGSHILDNLLRGVG